MKEIHYEVEVSRGNTGWMAPYGEVSRFATKKDALNSAKSDRDGIKFRILKVTKEVVK